MKPRFVFVLLGFLITSTVCAQKKGGNFFKMQDHFATTALAQAGAQGIAHHGVPHALQQQGAGMGDSVKLQMPAAHGGDDAAGENCHPRTRITRHRPTGRLHGDQHRGL